MVTRIRNADDILNDKFKDVLLSCKMQEVLSLVELSKVILQREMNSDYSKWENSVFKAFLFKNSGLFSNSTLNLEKYVKNHKLDVLAEMCIFYETVGARMNNENSGLNFLINVLKNTSSVNSSSPSVKPSLSPEVCFSITDVISQFKKFLLTIKSLSEFSSDHSIHYELSSVTSEVNDILQMWKLQTFGSSTKQEAHDVTDVICKTDDKEVFVQEKGDHFVCTLCSVTLYSANVKDHLIGKQHKAVYKEVMKYLDKQQAFDSGKKPLGIDDVQKCESENIPNAAHSYKVDDAGGVLFSKIGIRKDSDDHGYCLLCLKKFALRNIRSHLNSSEHIIAFETKLTPDNQLKIGSAGKKGAKNVKPITKPAKPKNIEQNISEEIKKTKPAKPKNVEQNISEKIKKTKPTERKNIKWNISEEIDKKIKKLTICTDMVFSKYCKCDIKDLNSAEQHIEDKMHIKNYELSTNSAVQESLPKKKCKVTKSVVTISDIENVVGDNSKFFEIRENMAYCILCKCITGGLRDIKIHVEGTRHNSICKNLIHGIFGFSASDTSSGNIKNPGQSNNFIPDRPCTSGTSFGNSDDSKLTKQCVQNIGDNTESLFEVIGKEIWQQKGNNYYCSLCNCIINGIRNVISHVRGERHVKSAKNQVRKPMC